MSTNKKTKTNVIQIQTQTEEPVGDIPIVKKKIVVKPKANEQVEELNDVAVPKKKVVAKPKVNEQVKEELNDVVVPKKKVVAKLKKKNLDEELAEQLEKVVLTKKPLAKPRVKQEIVYKEGHIIPKMALSEKEKNMLLSELTVVPEVSKDFLAPNVDLSFPVYREDETNYYVPKFWALNKFGPRFIQPVIEKNSQVDFTFNGSLRGTQNEVVEHIMKKLMETHGGLLQLHTGYGKTTIAIYIASILKLKTLVIVHKSFLMDQWYERIQQFTDASIGMIRQKKVDVDGKDIVLAMLQSLSMCDYDMDLCKDFDLVIVDECFPGYTRIVTDKGTFTIANLYDLWKNKKELPLIKSYNEITKTFEYNRLTHSWKKHTEELVGVKFGKKVVHCTPNHRFLTLNGYKEAHLLTNDDIVIGNYDDKLTENVFAKVFNDDQYQIMLGSFLGDGSIDTIKSIRYRFKIIHGIEQQDYCEWKASMFNCETTIIENNGYAKTKAIKFETKIFDSYDKFPNNRTTCPQWIIDKIDFRAIAIWVMDDGSINKKSPAICLSSCSFDEDTQIRLVAKLNSLGVKCKYFKCKRGYYYIRINKEGTDILIPAIFPYIHESMKYKITTKSFIEYIKINANVKYVWNDKYLDYGTCRITSVDKIKVDKTNRAVYDIEIENNHNFIIGGTSNGGPVVHNCHHVVSNVFSRAMFKINPKYTIALSATPTRADGLTKVLHWFLGGTIIKVARKCDNVVFAKSFDYDTNNPLFVEKKRRFNGVIKPDTVKILSNLCLVDERNRFISNIINELRKNDDRKILVLSKRIDHLKILKTMVDVMIKVDIENGLLCEDEITTSMYIGGLKPWQLKDAEEATIIFGSYAIANEGLDIGSLNTLVLATSIKDPVQAIGRIMRKQISDGEINPLIIDIGDKLSFFESWSKQRISYYNSNKYVVDKIQVYNDKCISMYDYMVKNKIIGEGIYDTDTLREKYITHLYGEITYKYEKKIKFRNYPDSMFDNKTDLANVLAINNDNIDYSKQGSIINYNPETVY